MKLVRYGEHGSEQPGLIDPEGRVRDLSAIVPDLADEALSRESLAEIGAMDHTLLPLVDGMPRLGACVGFVGNFIAVGLNYADHAAETGAAVPREPILFNKAPSCIIGPTDTVVLPKGSTTTDWEAELAIVIGTRASYVEEADALDHIAGFCVCNDVSERSYQKNRGGQWMKGKGCPTFGPLGPWLVTPDEIADIQALDIWLDLNGARMQTGSTATMIFGVKHIVSYVSQFMILEPGDVITTGTPPGVGLGKKPPLYLKAGDEMHLGITGLGEQRLKVVAYSEV